VLYIIPVKKPNLLVSTLRVQRSHQSKLSKFIIPISGTVIYAIQMYRTSFVLTTPSDPLQYVQPGIQASNGFQFLDRVFLWVVLRFMSFIGIPDLVLGPITTLLITSLVILIAALWLSLAFGTLTVSIFIAISLLNPFLISISTYTYPTQLLTLMLLINAIVFLKIRKYKYGYLIAGFGLTFCVFSKIQGFGLYLTMVIQIIFFSGVVLKKKLVFVFQYNLGFILGTISFFGLLSFIDGFKNTADMIGGYFSTGTAETQFSGASDISQFPNFFLYLKEPYYLFALFGIICCLILPAASLKFLALVPLGQFGSLIAIYFVTQRGGSVIPNYTYDFLIFGSCCFSIIVGILLNLSPHLKQKLIAAFLLMFGIVFCFLSSFTSLVGQIVIGTSKASAFAIFIAITMFFYLFNSDIGRMIFKLKDIENYLTSNSNLYNRKSQIVMNQSSTVIFLLCVTGVMLSFAVDTPRGYMDSHFKILETRPYHELGQAMRKFSGTVCVEAKLNRPSEADAGPRIRGVYETFYSDSRKRTLYVNGLDSLGNSLSTKCDYVITDNPQSRLLPMDFQEFTQDVVIVANNGAIVGGLDVPLIGMK
jgi:hypothetical protein